MSEHDLSDDGYGISPAKSALRDLRLSIEAAIRARDLEDEAQASLARSRIEAIRDHERDVARLRMLQYEETKARLQRDQEIAGMGGLTRGVAWVPFGGGPLGGGPTVTTNPYSSGSVGNIASTTTVLPRYSYSVPSADQTAQWGPGDVVRVKSLPPRIKGDIESATPYDFDAIEVIFPHESKAVLKVSLPPQTDDDTALMRKVMEHKGDHGCDQRVVWRPWGYPADSTCYFRAW